MSRRHARWSGNGHDADEEETHTLLADCVAESPSAWCVRVIRLGDEKPTDLWLPKSMCSREGQSHFVMPTWIAHKERLI